MDHMVLEIGLAMVLIAGAALLSGKLRFSIIPALIVVGMAVGPHAPHFGFLDLRFIESQPLIAFMGRLGILFLLFYLGLEFSIGRLMRSGRSIAISGTIYIAINLTIGLLFPWLLGWPLRETLIAAGITTISSSAIAAKVLVDLKRTANPETEIILGLIMFEDVFLAVYLSLISGLVLSNATSFGGVAIAMAMAFGFMVGVLMLGRLAIPWLNRVLNITSSEIFLLVIVAVLFLVAGLAETMHVAEAIAALLIGLVLAETEHQKRIEHLVIPFRDFFGALFFFSFGLSIDPFTLGGALWPALGAVALTLIGNYVAGMIAGRTTGLTPKASSRIGLTIVARGEFAIIMANMGLAGGLLPILQPFAALYVLILAVAAPLLSKESDAIYNIVTKIFPWGTRPQPSTHAAELPTYAMPSSDMDDGTPDKS